MRVTVDEGTCDHHGQCMIACPEVFNLVSPDKLEYVRAHPEQEVWLILHYAEPQERFVFIRPSRSKHYQPVEKVIRGAKERYVEFTDDSPEVVPCELFGRSVIEQIEAATS